MRHWVACLLVAPATCCVVLAGFVVPGPAAAATHVIPDARGDAPPRHDLRRATIGNNAHWVTLRIKVRNLRGGQRPQVAALPLASAAAKADFLVRTIRRGSGTFTRITRYDGGPGDPVHCRKRSRWRLGRDVITMRFHQNCLGGRGTLTASVAIGWGTGLSGDPADWTRVVSVRYD